MATPYLTSNDIIASIQRKIAVPLSQQTFSNNDLLAFVNDEMMITQVAEVLSYNQEFFVYKPTPIPLASNQVKYPIPDRAIGMALRDLFYQDLEGNLFEMTRVNPDDQAFFQSSSTNNQNVYKYYIENTDIVLTPTTLINPTGNLIPSIFLRPNQLVTNDRAATITSFGQTITINTPNPNDTVTIGSTTFTAVASGATGKQFNIGATSIDTASNLVASIKAANIVTNASNLATGNITSNVVVVTFPNISTAFSTSNVTAFIIPTTTIINFDSVSTSVFSNGSLIDFLQTKGGHKTYSYDVTIPSNGISGNSITFSTSDIPTNIVVGDYICNANECIIPQIPSELHNVLAERACARILAAQGDFEGLGVVNQKLQDMHEKQGNLLANRVKGNPEKVLARHSLLRQGKINRRQII